jgi:hypothetical protein
MLVTMLLSHDGDGAAKASWPWRVVDVESCWRQCCRVMLATVLPSHAGDGAAGATWLRCDVDAESFSRWCCRGDLDVARCRC